MFTRQNIHGTYTNYTGNYNCLIGLQQLLLCGWFNVLDVLLTVLLPRNSEVDVKPPIPEAVKLMTGHNVAGYEYCGTEMGRS